MINALTRPFRIDPGVGQRVFPFALFMAFIAIDESIRFAVESHFLAVPRDFLFCLYPLKAIVVAALLYHYRREYVELRLNDVVHVKTTAAVCAAGIATFILWIFLDWTLPLAGTPAGFNPTVFPEGAHRSVMTGVRVAGAVLVVPLMEELFWRSFLLRYLIDADFQKVPMGTFTWSSFLITTVLFGLEHHFFVAGMVAGAIYNVILYKTRSLAQCVLAHAVTNLALACYVLYSGKWHFW